MLGGSGEAVDRRCSFACRADGRRRRAHDRGRPAALCRDAAEHGTRVLYATPHVHADVGQLSADGRAAAALRRGVSGDARSVRQVRRSTCDAASRSTRERCPSRPTCATTVLAASGGYLVEFPGFWTPERDALALVHREAERAERAGLLPVLAHPERCAQIVEDPERVARVRRPRLAARAERPEPRRAPRPEVAGGGVAAARRRATAIWSRATRTARTRNARLDWAYELVVPDGSVKSVRAVSSTAVRSRVPPTVLSPPD